MLTNFATKLKLSLRTAITMRCFILALLALYTVVQPTVADLFLDNFERSFFTEFNKLETDGVRTDELARIIATGSQAGAGIGYNKQCLICRASVFTTLEYFKSNYTVAKLKDVAVTMCTLFLGSGSVYICNGYVNNFAVNELVMAA